MPTTIIGISGRIGSGKSTLASALERRIDNIGLCTVQIIPFAQEVKRIANEVFGWEGEKNARGRKLLVNVGMTGREYQRDFWIQRWWEIVGVNIGKAPQDKDVIIVDDVRFLNEIEFLIGLDAKLLYTWVPNLESNPPENVAEVEISRTPDAIKRAMFKMVPRSTPEEMAAYAMQFLNLEEPTPYD